MTLVEGSSALDPDGRSGPSPGMGGPATTAQRVRLRDRLRLGWRFLQLRRMRP